MTKSSVMVSDAMVNNYSDSYYHDSDSDDHEGSASVGYV